MRSSKSKGSVRGDMRHNSDVRPLDMTWLQSQIRLQDRLSHMLIDDRFAKAAPVKELPCLNWFGVWFVGPAAEDVSVPPAEEQTFLALERRLIEVAGTLRTVGPSIVCACCPAALPSTTSIRETPPRCRVSSRKSSATILSIA